MHGNYFEYFTEQFSELDGSSCKWAVILVTTSGVLQNDSSVFLWVIAGEVEHGIQSQ